jgi:cytochrome P450
LQAAGELYAYADELAARRREQPADDIVTRLLQPDDAGEVLTPSEFNLFFLLLTVAGKRPGACWPCSSTRTSGAGCWPTGT